MRKKDNDDYLSVIEKYRDTDAYIYWRVYN